MSNMKAVVLYDPGGADALKVERRPVPEIPEGWVRIRVRAFGLNRSELFTRQGHSPSVTLPRVLGIEAVGVVDQAPGTGFVPGEKVATVMGGMGRRFDGSYAEYIRVPAGQVRRISVDLPWEQLGALPEMLQTAWGSLFSALRLVEAERLLIRGGTTSVGMAAIGLARQAGAEVFATTRRPERASLLRDLGAEPVIDTGVLRHDGHRFDKVLELIGTTTLEDSLAVTAPGGSVCMTGMVGNSWSLPDFTPMEAIPHCVSLTTYSGGVADFMAMPFDRLLDDVASGNVKVRIGKVFRLDQIVEAHTCMEANTAGGKIVVMVD
ncbi:zinc-binding alcohol dehydrogenase family protein [Tropicimonas marinistellae]|uniref:zinc-binding alcohol dehydrogenase family protein n=1 Tax=Tropicimonas marinistellae TaxID=1739787 RepID=UPI00098F12DE|nr:zinc-binding alcohol dehydrogenase family protein [Tropicimonas marinistellae]